jgi:hypothetical protein
MQKWHYFIYYFEEHHWILVSTGVLEPIPHWYQGMTIIFLEDPSVQLQCIWVRIGARLFKWRYLCVLNLQCAKRWHCSLILKSLQTAFPAQISQQMMLRFTFACTWNGGLPRKRDPQRQWWQGIEGAAVIGFAGLVQSVDPDEISRCDGVVAKTRQIYGMRTSYHPREAPCTFLTFWCCAIEDYLCTTILVLGTFLWSESWGNWT